MERKGLAVCAGTAVGPVLRYRREAALGQRRYGDTPDQRFRRYQQALADARRELERLAAACGTEERELLLAQCTLLDDPLLQEEVRAAVETSQTDQAVDAVYRKYAGLLSRLEDPLLRARGADYLDMGRRLLDALEGRSGSGLDHLKAPCILVAEELLPSEVAALDREVVLAIATEGGSGSAHAAILARSRGIPMVVGVDGLCAAVTDGELLALEAGEDRKGRVWLRPQADLVDAIQCRAARQQRERKRQERWLPERARTRDGERVQVLLNLSNGAAEELAAAPYVDGVGLFRTEFLYLGRERPPTEEEQYRCYRRVLEAFGSRPVTLRTLDLGGDKWPSYITNRETGRRGFALSLEEPELLHTQLRAALRASVHGNLRLMLPMVADLEEIDRAEELLHAVEAELRAQGHPVGACSLGVMIEVAALARRADQVARRVDFASIGTNDLSHDLLGTDRFRREDEVRDQRYHPELLRLIGQAAAAFEGEGKDLSLCGELAGDPLAAGVLVGLGLRKLSVAPQGVAGLKERLASVDVTRARALAGEVLALESGPQVRVRLENEQREAVCHV